MPIRVGIDLGILKCTVSYNLKNPFLINPGKTKKIGKIDDFPEFMAIQHFPFEGPLISRLLIKKIGFPRKDLFIFSDDIEYSIKTVFEAKENILLVKSAKMFKLIPVQKRLMKKLDWRDYYFLRNFFYIQHKYGENFFVKEKPILLFIAGIAKVTVQQGFIFENYKIIWHALIRFL